MVAPSSLSGEPDPLFRPMPTGATFFCRNYKLFRIGAQPTARLNCLYLAGKKSAGWVFCPNGWSRDREPLVLLHSDV
jgi:hypothetical protein